LLEPCIPLKGKGAWDGGDLPLLEWNTGLENKWEIYFITQVQSLLLNDSSLSIWKKLRRWNVRWKCNLISTRNLVGRATVGTSNSVFGRGLSV
jgi:hypothetical protein